VVSYGDVENLKIVRSTDVEEACEPGALGCFEASAGEYRIVIPLAHDGNLLLMAHEYGHFIHWMYGYSVSDFATESVGEGLANHNALRYTLFRARFDGDGSRTHDADLPDAVYWGQYGANDAARLRMPAVAYANGEALPAPMNTSITDWDYLTYTPWDPATPCYEHSNEALNYPSDCGLLMSVVYWTLAFNTVRVGYGEHAAGQQVAAGTQILDTSYYSSDPAYLANDVFSYAIATLPNGASMQSFFNRVSEGYWQYRLSGAISPAESHRVNVAIAVHCVGWSAGVCNSTAWHRTAEQKRPAAFTAKASFAQSNPPQAAVEHFERAEDMTVSNASEISWGTSGDGFKFVRLDGSGASICKTLTFPQSGTYRVHAAVRAPSFQHNTVWVGIDAPPTVSWTVTTTAYGPWIWSHNGPLFTVTAGSHQVCISKYLSEQVEIDAIWLKKQ
jgi:hypothetical protein